jgi:hypothetical protein
MNELDGKWDCTVKSPLGERKSTMTVVVDGDSWTGTNEADGNSLICENGKVDGNTLTWTMRLTKPMPVTVECRAVIDGDVLTGTTKAGTFGAFPMTGTRQV